MKMICDFKRGNRLIAALVIILSLSQRTTGGSWRNLERLFIQENSASKHWNENRIIFPDMVEDPPEFSSPSTATRGDKLRPCQADCAVSREYSPVCGTNGVTYQNMGQLLCDIRCGVDVDLHRPSSCSATTRPFTTRPNPPATTTTTSSPTFATVSDDEIERCIRSCPTTPEYNPVCGTNQVTYHNIGKLECARMCGVDVKFWRHARCPKLRTTTTSSTEAPTTNSDLDKEIEECMIDCPSTPEYNPICGSNNITYTNIGRMECARWCGVDVHVQKRGRCEFLAYALSPYPNHSDTAPDVDYGDDNIDPRFRPRDQREFHGK